MTNKHDIDEYIEAALKKHKHDKTAALRETAHRLVHFYDEKERLEKRVESLTAEVETYKTGSVNE